MPHNLTSNLVSMLFLFVLIVFLILAYVSFIRKRMSAPVYLNSEHLRSQIASAALALNQACPNIPGRRMRNQISHVRAFDARGEAVYYVVNALRQQ